MSDQEGMSVIDAVSEGRYHATFALRNLFGVTDLASITEWVIVISALQSLPKQLVDEIGIPIIAKFFEEENLDPQNAGDRAIASPFAEVIATSVTTAAQYVFANMQQQAVQQEKTRSRLLNPGRIR